MEVCKNGSICLRRKSGVSTEEFRVSADGMEVAVAGDNNRQINMSYSTLQPRFALSTASHERFISEFSALVLFYILNCQDNFSKFGP